MKLFHCVIADYDGTTHEEYHEALSEDILVRELGKQGRVPVRIIESQRGIGSTKKSHGLRLPRSGTESFTSTMAMLLHAGLSVKDALEILQGLFRNSRLQDFVQDMVLQLERGGSFSQALDRYSKSFPEVYSALVRIGEQTGNLEMVFRELDVYLREQKKLRDASRGAMLYPGFVLAITMIGVAVLVTVFLPMIQDIFLGIAGPQAARMDALVSSFSHITFVFLALVILFFLVFAYASWQRRYSPEKSGWIDRIVWKIPVIGTVKKYRKLLNWAFAMETLTSNGISVEKALAHAASVAESPLLQNDIQIAREKVMKGMPISRAFSGSNWFPEEVVRWLAVGERTGQVDHVFKQLRMYFSVELENRTRIIVQMMEPVLIVIMGGILLVIISIFVLPIFTLYGEML